ncbi:hypothetical protein GCM10027592_23780 [Spirosoma flavus]
MNKVNNKRVYFYAYYRTPKITLHLEDCPFCNYGRGLQTNVLGNAMGRWHGGFFSYEEAKDAAQKLEEKLKTGAVTCKRCRPDTQASS